MCAAGQEISHTQHFLMSAYGSKWKEVTLVVFTVYVDDSGTSPSQKLAVASALIIPAIRIPRIDQLWDGFRAKHGFRYIHASEMASPHRKEQYADWPDDKVDQVLARARRIIRANSTAGYAFVVDKKMFNSSTPTQWRAEGGQNHYTWALRTLLQVLIRWHGERKLATPFEWVFDNAVGRDRDEIEMLMAQFDSLHPGRFEGHYSFRCKANVPCLQGADILAWSTYSMACETFFGTPRANPFAERSLQDWRGRLNDEWLMVRTYDEKALQLAIEDDERDPSATRERTAWYRKWSASVQSRKASRPKREKCPC
jgi:uncharacterized protein DUF3800